MDYQILNKINSPDDVKKLNKNEINLLCNELRDCILETVSKNGGHLASNLGSVELTVALHRVFSSPKDALIFDVGHQCYPHKLLTGRFKNFSSLRTEGGISGFMRPDESEHDPIVTGHSSNSVSAAFGIYQAKRISGQEGTAIAVIGDGAMTGGMAYEALNNSGNIKGNFIVVLNDNKMSISSNVGSFARNLTKMRNKPRYHFFKFALSRFLLKIPFIGTHLNRGLITIKDAIKGIIYKQNIFSALGFNYLGPVDGHNVEAMEALFRIAESYNRPSLVHVVTVKGKGYSYAETSPKDYHGVSPFDIDDGVASGSVMSFSSVAGNTLCRLAKVDNRICAITAAMTNGTGLYDFSLKFKDRFFDVGIAEEHALTFSAGIAKGGMKPFFAVYSSFLQRAYDQIIHDAAIASLPIKLLIDRAGIVGEDGETHHGVFDVSFLTSIPNIEIYSPASFEELEYDIEKISNNNKLSAVRYPRGGEKAFIPYDYKEDFSVIKGNSDTALVTYGRLYSEASSLKNIKDDINIIKLNKIYPFSNNLIDELKGYNKIHFYEEAVRNGGIGEHLLFELNRAGYKGDFIINALDNCFISMGSVSSLLNKNGLDFEHMEKNVKE